MRNDKPFNIIKAECPEFYEWLKEISRLSKVESFILPDYKNGMRVYLYTHNYGYNIVVKPPKKQGRKDEAYLDGYLGCTVLDRKPIAGENWQRGRDLADGKYCYETWQKIKDDIIAFELVKIAKPKQDSVKFIQ